MKELLEKIGKALGLKKALTEENLLEEVESALAQKDATIAEKNQEIEGLKTSAADGNAYRKSLVDDALRFGALIDEVPSDESGQKSEGEFLESLSIARLKATRDKYETRAREKFPTHSVFTGKDETDRQKQNHQAQQQGKQLTGRKDYTDPANNELLATVGK